MEIAFSRFFHSCEPDAHAFAALLCTGAEEWFEDLQANGFRNTAAIITNAQLYEISILPDVDVYQSLPMVGAGVSLAGIDCVQGKVQYDLMEFEGIAEIRKCTIPFLCKRNFYAGIIAL